MKANAITRGVLFGALVAGTSSVAMAGQGFYVQVVNDLKEDITVQMTNRYNTSSPTHQIWYPKDFESPSNLAAGEKKTYYTEVCEAFFGCRYMNKWGWIRLETETRSPNWRGKFDLSYYPGSDNPTGYLSCLTVFKRGGVKSSKEHISLRKDGDQYVATVKVTDQGIECE